MKFAQSSKTVSTVVACICVLALIFAIGAVTVVNNAEKLFFQNSSDSAASVKDNIASVFKNDLAGFGEFLNIYGAAQRVAGTTVFEDAGYTYIIKDSGGNLHFHTLPCDAAPYAAAVSELDVTLKNNGIPLIYMQAPTKEIDGYTDFPPGIVYASADNAADMLQELGSFGVETVSLSAVLEDKGIPAEKRFYKTDHHWTTESAFAAAAYTVDYINKNHGTALDAELYNPVNWNSITMRSSFLGSAGRRIGAALAGLDDYTFLEPLFETSYDVYYPKISDTWPNWSGDFHAAFVRDSVLYSDDVFANRYASYFEYDYGELIICNLLAENDLNITIIKDSFALPYGAFLSTAVKKIDMIDLREFEGSVTDHILETSPDFVIILYSNSSFKDTMYDFKNNGRVSP